MLHNPINAEQGKENEHHRHQSTNEAYQTKNRSSGPIKKVDQDSPDYKEQYKCAHGHLYIGIPCIVAQITFQAGTPASIF
jgi:hypothetical protein